MVVFVLSLSQISQQFNTSPKPFAVAPVPVQICDFMGHSAAWWPNSLRQKFSWLLPWDRTKIIQTLSDAFWSACSWVMYACLSFLLEHDDPKVRTVDRRVVMTELCFSGGWVAPGSPMALCCSKTREQYGLLISQNTTATCRLLQEGRRVSKLMFIYSQSHKTQQIQSSNGEDF